MKIGLLTFPFNNNYGGFLQAFALMAVLKQNGHEVELINRRFFDNNGFLYLKKIRYILSNRIKHGKRYFTMEEREKQYMQSSVNTYTFVENYIFPRTEPLYTTKQLRQKCKNRYDAIFVGSDQVWRAGMVTHVETFFCDFLCKDDKAKIISYAASFGIDNPPYNSKQRHVCGMLLNRFQAISVRESSGVDLIKNKYKWTKKAVEVVLDPTLLLDASDYRKIVTKNLNLNKKFIFCYILDKTDEKICLINGICKKKNCIPYYILPKYAPTDYWKNICDRIMPPVDSFIDGIDNSEFVITDSFHGTVFSLIFRKKFLVFTNKERGNTRIKTLLSYFKAEKKLVNPCISIDRALNLIYESTDFDNLNFRLKKNESISYIKENLKQC